MQYEMVYYCFIAIVCVCARIQKQYNQDKGGGVVA